MAAQEDKIEETLREPEVVVQSASDPEARLYHRFFDKSPVGAKHLCAVVKWRSDESFLITAYFTDRPKRGQILWPSE